MDALLNCSPTSHNANGLSSVITVHATPRLTSPVLRRCRPVAMTARLPMTAARITAASPPTSSACRRCRTTVNQTARLPPTSRTMSAMMTPAMSGDVGAGNNDDVRGAGGVELVVQVVGDAGLDAQDHAVGERGVGLGQGEVEEDFPASASDVELAIKGLPSDSPSNTSIRAM